MRITHLKIQGTSQWRWLLVLPAFLIGAAVPGFLILHLWEMGSSLIPGLNFLMMRVSEILQTIADGVCSVVFAGYVAPRRARVVRLVAATMNIIVFGGLSIHILLNKSYQGNLELSWDIVLVATHILAVIAAGLVRDLRQPPSPDILYRA